jgi:hypothetical protein
MSRDLPLLGVGGASFSPPSISGMKLWLKADALVLNDGDAVGTWADSSANANDAMQATAANKPTFKTNIVNGKPVVRFDGVNDYLNLPNAFSGLTAAEVFIVLRLANDPPAVDTKTGLWTFGSDAQNTHFPYTDGVVYDQFGTTARKNTGDPTTDFAAAFRLYNVVSQAGEWTSRINTTQHYTTATNTVGFTTAPLLGYGNVGGGNYYLDGDVAEALLYDSVLSGSNRASVENYLNGKYALY